MYQVSQAHISVWVKRGKLQLTEAGLIDTTHQLNSALILRLTAIKGLQETTIELVLPPIKTKAKPEKPQNEVLTSSVHAAPVMPIPTPSQTNTKTPSLALLEVEQRIETLRKTRQQADLLELESDKKRGEFLRVEHARLLVIQLSRSFVSRFHDAADFFIMDIAKTKDLSRAEVSLMRGRLVDIINQASTEGVQEAKTAIRAGVKQLETERKRGQRNSVRT